MHNWLPKSIAKLFTRLITYHCWDFKLANLVTLRLECLTIVYSTIYSGADQRIHQSSTSLAFVGWIHRWQVNCPHKGWITRKMFPFDYVIMVAEILHWTHRISSEIYCNWVPMANAWYSKWSTVVSCAKLKDNLVEMYALLNGQYYNICVQFVYSLWC